MADQMWLFGPVGDGVKSFMASLGQYPFQKGASNNPANINYNTVKAKSSN